MPVADLEDSVERELSSLPNLQVDAPGRHQSLQVAMDWSWSLLSEADRAVLDALGVFADHFTVRRAMAVLGPATASALHRLRAASLLHMEASGTLRLLVPVRRHARERSGRVWKRSRRADRLCGRGCAPGPRLSTHEPLRPLRPSG